MSGVAIVASAWIACSVAAAPFIGRLLRHAGDESQSAVRIPDFIPDDVLASVDLSPPRR